MEQNVAETSPKELEDYEWVSNLARFYENPGKNFNFLVEFQKSSLKKIQSINFPILFSNSSFIVYSDAILLVEGREFYVHRVLLVAQSTYFQKAFDDYDDDGDNPNDKPTLKVDTGFRGAEKFDILLKFMYTGVLSLDGKDVIFTLSFLKTALAFGVDHLQIKLQQVLINQLDISNIYLILELCLKNSDQLTTLNKAALTYVDEHAVNLFESGLLHFEWQDLEFIIKRNTLKASTMEKIEFLQNHVKQIKEMKANEEPAEGDEENWIKMLEMFRSHIDLNSLTDKQIIKVARDTDIFEIHYLLDFILKRKNEPIAVVVKKEEKAEEILSSEDSDVEMEENLNASEEVSVDDNE